MPEIRSEIARILAIEDPLARSTAALAAMEDARQLQAELRKVRGLSVYEIYLTHGAGGAARLLGISRPSLHRIVALHTPQEVKAERAARQDALMGIVKRQLASLDASED